MAKKRKYQKGYCEGCGFPDPLQKHDHNRERGAIAREFLSSDASLAFTFEAPTRHTRWSHQLKGTSYGKPFSVHLTQEGVKELAQLLIDAL